VPSILYRANWERQTGKIVGVRQVIAADRKSASYAGQIKWLRNGRVVSSEISAAVMDCETIRRVGIDIDQRSPVGVQLKMLAVQRARAVQLKGRLVLGMRLFIAARCR